MAPLIQFLKCECGGMLPLDSPMTKGSMIDLRLSEAQAAALLSVAARGTPPPELDGRNLAALARATARLDIALSVRRSIPEHAATCDDISDLLSSVSHARFVVLAHARLLDLRALCRLWARAEKLPLDAPGAELVDVARVDEPGWRAEVTDALRGAGLGRPT